MLLTSIIQHIKYIYSSEKNKIKKSQFKKRKKKKIIEVRGKNDLEGD